MTMPRLFALLTITLIALSTGWLVKEPTITVKTEPLEIPDNIDYYMSQVNYQAMTTEGTQHYRLRSPYLEHFIREDVSHIQQPDIDYNTETAQWLVRSSTGYIQHQQGILELNQQATVNRINTEQPVKLSSDQILLNPDLDLIEIPKPLTMTSNQLYLEADSAKIDMKVNHFQFQQVNATYQPSQEL